MNFITLDFFYTIRAFYAWVFPLNVMVTVSMVAGLAVGIFSRRKSWLRRGFGAVCLVSLAATELIWQLYPSEYLILFFYVCGWCAEAALLCLCIGMAARFLWTKIRGR